MTMSPVEMQRKVRQLDNDVCSIYEMLVSIQVTQQRHGNRVEELAEMVAAHDARFDTVDARFDAIDARFDAHDARFDAHDARFDALEGKLDNILDLLQGGRPSAPEAATQSGD